LVVCVGHYLGSGHGFALAGERFVGLVAEDIAQVRDRSAQFGLLRHGERVEPETADGGCRLVAAHPVKNCREGSHGCPQICRVPRVVVIADRQGDVVQRAERVTVLGLEPCQEARQECGVAAVAAVFGSLPPAASGLESSDPTATI
jgi:hypothetical protein